MPSVSHDQPSSPVRPNMRTALRRGSSECGDRFVVIVRDPKHDRPSATVFHGSSSIRISAPLGRQ
jgi:hypothetical protein